jgi:hypothetical protein
MWSSAPHFSADNVVVIPWDVWGQSGIALDIRPTVPDGYYRLIEEGSSYMAVFYFHLWRA